MFDNRFRLFVFTIARSRFVVSAALHLLWTTTEGVHSTYRGDDHVQVGKALLVVSRPFVVHLIDFMAIKEMVYNHSHNLSAVFMAW